ncbi:MAG TPA: tetratricopeptide repeat protein [Phototrophicaceae bacterium]|nr:tetratricopeptide repeat protein [Phototrophicaceae bacterium]
MKFIWVFMLLALLSGCDVNPAERVSTGNELYYRGEYLAALAAYQAAQVAASDLPEPYYNAASALAQSGQMERAVAALEQALALADTELTATAYYNLGNVYFEMSHFPQAVQAYQQALLLNPGDADARYNLELALKRIVPPTPPSGDQPQPTPTNADNGQSVATATPTPSPGGDMANELEPQSTEALTVEEAQQLLDAIQRDQQTLSEYLRRLTPQAAPLEKDW